MRLVRAVRVGYYGDKRRKEDEKFWLKDGDKVGRWMEELDPKTGKPLGQKPAPTPATPHPDIPSVPKVAAPALPPIPEDKPEIVPAPPVTDRSKSTGDQTVI